MFLSAGPYSGILKELIHKLKYDRKEFVSSILGRFLLEFIKMQQIDLSCFDYIIPVPLSSARFRERGFNQAELISRELSGYYDLPFDMRSLRRRHHQYPQAVLTRSERLRNLDGVFKLAKNTPLNGRSVILIDDVRSTGSTIYFSAQALFEGGVKNILSLTLALNE